MVCYLLNLLRKNFEMNILYISSKKKWGGVITWMQKTALGLKKRGHKVYIISHPNSQFTKNADKAIKLIPKRIGATYSPYMIFYLIKFIKKFDIGLVLTNIEKEIVAGGIAAKICNIPNIRRVGNEGDFKNGLRYKLHHKWLVDCSMTISIYTKQKSQERVDWINSKKFFVIYHGRNNVNYSKKRKCQEKKTLNISESKFVFGVTSRLDEQKGIGDIIRAFNLLTHKHNNIILLITGIGSDEKKLKKMVENFKIEKKVIFAGFTKDPMLRASIYDIALTYTYNEAIPNTLFEYLGAGCATISSRVGGIPELIVDGENGLLVEEKKFTLLAEKMRILLENKNTRKSLSKGALISMDSKFSEDIMIDNVENLYRSVINENRYKFIK